MINKKYYWLIGGLFALVNYLLLILILVFLSGTELELWQVPIVFPFLIMIRLGIRVHGDFFGAFIISGLLYFFVGSVIGLILSKIKKYD